MDTYTIERETKEGLFVLDSDIGPQRRAHWNSGYDEIDT